MRDGYYYVREKDDGNSIQRSVQLRRSSVVVNLSNCLRNRMGAISPLVMGVHDACLVLHGYLIHDYDGVSSKSMDRISPRQRNVLE